MLLLRNRPHAQNLSGIACPSARRRSGKTLARGVRDIGNRPVDMLREQDLRLFADRHIGSGDAVEQFEHTGREAELAIVMGQNHRCISRMRQQHEQRPCRMGMDDIGIEPPDKGPHLAPTVQRVARRAELQRDIFAAFIDNPLPQYRFHFSRVPDTMRVSQGDNRAVMSGGRIFLVQIDNKHFSAARCQAGKDGNDMHS